MRTVIIVAVGAVVLGIGSTLVLAATGVLGPSGGASGAVRGPAGVASLPGAGVDVTLTDMGAMMGGRGPMMGHGSSASGVPRSGMRVGVAPSTVPAGTVSLRVSNTGHLVHELVVLPLNGTTRPGERSIGPDGTVDETGSLGEASNSNGADHGEGIGPGAVGWTTLQLQPGRYELVCNLPGHYAAGMFAELDVRQ